MPTPKILIVENTPDLNELITLALETNHYQVQSAHTYQRAKHLLQTQAFDAIILDYELDGKETGLDLLPFIKDKSKTLIFSGAASYDLQRYIRKHKKIEYLPKTAGMSCLLKKITSMLHESKACEAV